MQHLNDKSSLSEWLEYLESPHQNCIKLGLERVSAVADKLGLLKPQCPVITVSGTNGKGSTVAMLEAVYVAAGYQVAAYTSPHLLNFNERIKHNAKPVSDEQLCVAFNVIEKTRGDIFLSYFELVTLAALWIFSQFHCDVIILEVGLGGRLDATNIINADMAIITAIDLDHTELLGNTRAAIAAEKAGIMRPTRPIICGDRNPPQCLIEIAKQLQSPLAICGKDYDIQLHHTAWEFKNNAVTLSSATKPYLMLDNVATVIQTLLSLQKILPLAADLMINTLVQVTVPGRFQIISGSYQTIFDVAHNPHAARNLAYNLQQVIGNGKKHAVFSMLADKDIKNTVAPLAHLIDVWHIAPIENNRAASIASITHAFNENGIQHFYDYQDIMTAFHQSSQILNPGDTLLIFGSFFTVSQILLRPEFP